MNGKVKEMSQTAFVLLVAGTISLLIVVFFNKVLEKEDLIGITVAAPVLLIFFSLVFLPDEVDSILNWLLTIF